MSFQRVSFKNSSGENLSGRIDFPLISQPKAYVLFAHCFTCSKNFKSVDFISQAFTQQGMAVLRFDFTGLGQSGGDFADTNFSSNLSDLKEAYQFLEHNFEAPKILVGHSLGGAAVLHVGQELDKVQAVATIGAPSTPGHVTHLLADGKEKLNADGEAEINIGGRPFRMKKQFLDDLEKKNNFDSITDLGKPLLILHSPQDTIVQVENAQEIYIHARHPKSFISLDGANHLLTEEKDAKYTGMMIANWALKYIDIEQAEEISSGEVKVRLEDADRFTTEIIAGRHHLIGDEPREVGGKDLGPAPYGYLLSALGTCTAMTLRMYAEHKKLDLKRVEVQLSHDKIQKDDVLGKKDQIKVNLILEGNLTAEQRTRLLEIAEKCPVHKTLKSVPEMLLQFA